MLSVFAFAALAAPTKIPPPEISLDLPYSGVQTYDLGFKSGLRIVVQQDHAAPIVVMTTVVSGGSSADPEGQHGAAHLVEHLWFRSVYDGKTVWETLAERGCAVDAETMIDRSLFSSVCPLDAVPTLLRLESLRLAKPLEGVTEEVFAAEVERLGVEELAWSPDALAAALPHLLPMMFPADHPYGRIEPGVADLTLEVARERAKAMANPADTTLLLVGDLDPRDVSQLIVDQMEPTILDPRLTAANVAKAPAPGLTVSSADPNLAEDWIKVLVDPDDPNAPLRVDHEIARRVKGDPEDPPAPQDLTLPVVRVPVDQPTVIVAWSVPGAWREEAAVYRRAAAVLEQWAQNFFYATDRGVPPGGVWCELWAGVANAAIVCGLPHDEDADPERVAEQLTDQVSMLWSTDNLPHLELEVDRGRLEEIGTVLSWRDGIGWVGSLSPTARAASWLHYTGQTTYQSARLEEARSVTAKQVSDAAFAWMKRQRAVRIALVPTGIEASSQAPGAIWHGARSGDDQIPPRLDQPTAEIDVALLASAPPIADAFTTSLPNGLDVLVVRREDAALAYTGLVLGTGRVTSPPFGLDDLEDRFRASTWSDDDNANDPEQILGTWTGSRADDHVWVALTGLPGNTDSALWMLREAMLAMHPNLYGKGQWLKDVKADVLDGWSDRGWHVNRVRSEHLAAGHPVGFEWDWDTVVAAKKWNASMLTAYMAKKYQPANATLVIVGDVEPVAAVELAKKYLGDWAPAEGVEVGEMPPLPPPPAELPSRRTALFDVPDAKTGALTLSCRVDATGGTESVDLLRTVVDGALWDALDGAVWVDTTSTDLGGGNAFLDVQVEVPADHAGSAVTAMRKALDDLAAGTIDPDALVRSKVAVARAWALDDGSTDRVAQQVVAAVGHRYPLQSFAQRGERLAAVDAAALAKALAPCAGHDIVLLEGPAGPLGEGLKAAGVDHDMVDWGALRAELVARYNP